jgi:hypothetical protein
MSKKAMEEMTLTIIIGIAILIAMLGVSTVANAKINEARHREICRLSIVEAELKKEATTGISKPAIDCPMLNINIKKSDLAKKNKENYVKRIFADAMRDAWMVAGQGDHRTFQQQWFKGGDVHCLLYAKINFKDTEIKKEDLNAMSMTTWLSANNPGAESPEAYFKYLTYENKRAWSIISASDPKDWTSEEIDPSKNYYVVYWAAMKDSGILRAINLDEHVKELVELVKVKIMDKPEEIPLIVVVPEDEFEGIGCEHMLN